MFFMVCVVSGPFRAQRPQRRDVRWVGSSHSAWTRACVGARGGAASVMCGGFRVTVSVLGCHDSFGRSAYFDMLTFLPCVYRSEGRYVWWSLDVEVMLRSCVAVLMSRVHVGVSFLCCQDSFGRSGICSASV